VTASFDRLITVFPILWFCLNCLGRRAQHLAITTLELTTLGFILCTLGTYYLWFHKPMDVGVPVVLGPNATIAQLLIDADDSARAPYKCTPLDFIRRERARWQVHWTYWMNILRKLKIEFATRTRPINKIPDDYFHPISRKATCFLVLAPISFAALHIRGWNFPFVTRIEQILWHISTLAIMTSIIGYWFVDLFTWKIVPFLRSHIFSSRSSHEETQEQEVAVLGHKHSQLQFSSTVLPNISSSLRNNLRDRHPPLDIPLKALIPVIICGTVYCFAREYIFEAFIYLRSLPPSAYETVAWSAFIPHF
jgi:hypothetical protein